MLKCDRPMFRWSLPKIPTAPFCPSEVQGSVPIPSRGFLAQTAGVFGSGFAGVSWVYGPRKLGDRYRRGCPVWLQSIKRYFSLESHCNSAAIFVCAIGDCFGARSGTDMPPSFQSSGQPCALVFAEIAIVATDLAEILGSALALNLLFHIPLAWGVCITGFDLVVVLLLQGKRFRWLEALILGLVSTIALCFLVEIVFSQPKWGDVALGFLPQVDIVQQPDKLYLAVSILGATVMPHNLYLHSAIVQTRVYDKSQLSQKEAVRYATLDSTISLIAALFVNASILIVAAAAFHFTGNQQVAEIQDAYRLLSPLLGTGAASLLFGLALLASGQSSTFTGTIAGQVIMEGFLDMRIPCWLRRVITRGLAIVPALIGLTILGEQGLVSC